MAEVEATVLPGLTVAARRLLRELRAQVTYDVLLRLLERGDWDLVATLPVELEQVLLQATRRAAVTLAVRNVPRVTRLLGLATEVQFDIANPAALARVVAHGARAVREVGEATRTGITTLIREQLVDGVNPREVARDIRPLIGLTESQARTVVNYGKALRSGTTRALDYALRDKRSDSVIARAARTGKPLTPAQITSLVDRYTTRLIAYRAEVIARTESIRALSEGRRLAMDAALRDPAVGLTPDDMVRRWVVAFSERTCPFCRQIPQQQPDGVGYDEPFVVQYKGRRYELMDAPAHPQCRCVVFVQPRSSVVT